MHNKKKKRLIKISPARVAVILLAGLIVGLWLYFVNAVVFSPDAIPMPFGTGAGVVLSGSMEPALRVNDLIIVRRADEYAVGDVVIYRSGRMPVVHRLVSISDTTAVTKGDANNTTDHPISPSDISGRVVCSIPKAGLAVDFLQSSPGMLVIFGGALLLLELSFRGERKRGNREIEEVKAEIRRLKAQNDGGNGDHVDHGDEKPSETD